MDKFLIDYIERLKEYSNVPKFQNERSLAVILSLYLEKIISMRLKEKYKLITIELPIDKKKLNNKNPNTKHTINIDFLFFNNNDNIALLVELKAEAKEQLNKKFMEQVKNYITLKDMKFKDVVPEEFQEKPIRRKGLSRKEEKNNTQRNILSEKKLDNIKEIKIMYIAPDIIIDKLKRKEFDIDTISFSELIEIQLDDKLDDNWEIIKEYIKKLNKKNNHPTYQSK